VQTPRIILASASPRRRELLTRIGIPHHVHPADLDESVRPGERPDAYTERLAREKASAVAASYPGAVVIAADTTVVVDGQILGKPADAIDAEAMLAKLVARTHQVFTGMAVVRDLQVVSAVDRVEVRMRSLSPDEISAYVETGEPMDKAGAYGIQGYGATIVDRIDGDFFAVMGLGLVTTVRLLGEMGLRYRTGDGLSE
jgi:septum formation protein